MLFFGKVINTMEENPNRENIMEVWKDYTIENAINIYENAMKVIKLQNNKFCWKTIRYDFRDLQQIQSKIM